MQECWVIHWYSAAADLKLSLVQFHFFLKSDTKKGACLFHEEFYPALLCNVSNRAENISHITHVPNSGLGEALVLGILVLSLLLPHLIQLIS